MTTTWHLGDRLVNRIGLGAKVRHDRVEHATQDNAGRSLKVDPLKADAVNPNDRNRRWLLVLTGRVSALELAEG